MTGGVQGDVALSVLMTTSTTVGTIFMTPLLAKLVLGTIVPVDAMGIVISTIQVRPRGKAAPLPALPACLQDTPSGGTPPWLGHHPDAITGSGHADTAPRPRAAVCRW